MCVRLQAEEKLRGLSNLDAAAREEAEISKLFEPLKTKLSDTLFTYFLLNKFKQDWQSHLERISGYLSFGEGSWWCQTEQGVKFLDAHDGPILHHFRSSTFYKEEKCLKANWSDCITIGIPIPLHFTGSILGTQRLQRKETLLFCLTFVESILKI